jgi:hypothetical protein
MGDFVTDTITLLLELNQQVINEKKAREIKKQSTVAGSQMVETVLSAP